MKEASGKKKVIHLRDFHGESMEKSGEEDC